MDVIVEFCFIWLTDIVFLERPTAASSESVDSVSAIKYETKKIY